MVGPEGNRAAACRRVLRLRLLNNGLTKSYLQALEAIEQAGIYMPGGENPL